MKNDRIDRLQGDWEDQRPELDNDAMGIVLRLQMLARILGEQASACLAEHGLEWWQYDVLSTLRRQGRPFRLPASELARQGLLSTGATTHRIDRLEDLDWVQRRADPHDRRRVLVGLTRRGRRMVDRATEARFEVAESALKDLDRPERQQLVNLLKQLLATNPPAIITG